MGIKVESFSDRAVLVTGYTAPPTHLVGPLTAALHAHPAAASWRVQAGLTSLLVAAPAPAADMSTVVDAALAALTDTIVTAPPATSTHRVVPCDLDGDDLLFILDHADMSADEFARVFASITWQVAVFGFAPGFAYLQPATALPWGPLPRLATPRPLAPAGAVCFADTMACIYPGTTPSGWQWVGTCTLDLFDPTTGRVWADIGDTVAFEPRTGTRS